jgi:hypothetical protein
MNKFAKLSTARQLTDAEMIELRGGGQKCDSCTNGCSASCKQACSPGNKNNNNNVPITIDATMDLNK